MIKKFNCAVLVILLISFGINAVAHEGEPNMGFAWREGVLEIDIRKQGTKLGDLSAFVIRFTDSIAPYRMGDAGFTGIEFDQGGILGYQAETHLMKWSSEQSQWLTEGFSEQIIISRLSDEKRISASEGKGIQGFIENLTNTSTFESHPIFKIQKPDGQAPEDGAYMVIITVLGVDATGENILYQPSQPFALVFHINAKGNFNGLALSEALDVPPALKLNNYNRMDALFNWAEENYSRYFPHAVKSRFIEGYYARCYNNGTCLGSLDGKIYTLGGELGGLTDHGAIETFYQAAGL